MAIMVNGGGVHTVGAIVTERIEFLVVSIVIATTV